MRLRLYTTLGCHLCEQLEARLEVLGVDGLVLERVEIADDAALMARYGERIPVLADEAGAELERGFEAERLATWLAERGGLREREEEAETPAPRGAYHRGGRRFLG